MKSNEFITESDAPIDTRGMPFGKLGEKRVTIHIGELTDAVGIFLEFHGIVVDQVGFNSIARIHGNDLPAVEDAHRNFNMWMDGVSEIQDIGQSRYGFKVNVANETPEQYAETLENILRNYKYK